MKKLIVLIHSILFGVLVLLSCQGEQSKDPVSKKFLFIYKDVSAKTKADNFKSLIETDGTGNSYVTLAEVDEIPLDTLEVNYNFCGSSNAQNFRVEDDTAAIWNTPNNFGLSTGEYIQI